MSIVSPDPDGKTFDVPDLPDWVWWLVQAISDSEDEHPRYYADTYRGMVRIDRCPQSEFLALVPENVRRAVSR